MIFFNIAKLEELSECKPDYFMELFEVHLNKTKTGKSKTLRDLRLNLNGDSYLLNPVPLLLDKSVSIVHKVQYIRLAAKRSYADYAFTNVKSLDRSFFPDLILDNIKHNPLLQITQTEIIFKYEEEKIWQSHSAQPKVRHNQRRSTRTSTKTAKT